MQFDSVELHQAELNLVPALIIYACWHWVVNSVKCCLCVWLSRDEPVSLPSGVIDSTLYANEIVLVLPNYADLQTYTLLW